ncbi:MAG: EamA family transporter RarD [Ilumatobacteraceae bacterium]
MEVLTPTSGGTTGERTGRAIGGDTTGIPWQHDDPSRHRAGIVWGVAAYVFWGLVTVYWKALNHFDAFELIGYRITTSALLMGVYCAATRRLLPLLRQLRNVALLRRVTFASVMLTVNWTTYVWAVVHGRVIETALGYFITPIGLMLAGVLVLHEQMRRVQQAALVLAVAAVIVLTVGYGSFPWVSLLIAISWVSYAFTKKRTTMTAVEGLTAETFVLAVPALVLVLWSASLDTGAPQTATATQWVLLALAGVVTTAPLLMFAMAAHRLPLTVMALLQYIVPTINFLLGWLAYHEQLSVVRVAGFALVWAGLAAVTTDSLRRMRRSPITIAGVTE